MSSTINENPDRHWSPHSAYSFATTLLLLGVVVGFLLRGPRDAAATRPSAAPQPASKPAPARLQITSAELKQIADAKAAPLLAQLKEKPDDPEVLVKLGYVYFATRNFKEAADYYLRSASIKDSPIVRTELGRAFYYAGDPDGALTEFNHVLKLDPNNADALVNIGMIRWRDKLDSDGAIKAWTLMLKRNPNHPQKTQVEELIARVRLHGSER